jgi:hypothetical protein
MALENASPLVYQVSEERKITPSELDESVRDPFDSREVFGRTCTAFIIKESRNINNNKILSEKLVTQSTR